MKVQTIVLALCGLFAPDVCRSQEKAPDEAAVEDGLIGWWKLEGDCRDYSGNKNHGKNHGVNLKTASFDGRGAYIEIPHSESLTLKQNDFTISAWVYTEKHVTDVLGDVVSKYDPARRRGFTLNLKSSSGGYQSCGDDRQVHFGIDNGKVSDWQDCGRPSNTSNYVSNSLTVFRGNLYAAITDAQDEKDWAHVFRYDGGKKWTDCGRVGKGKTTGVMSLIVHQGALYAATTTYDWTRVFSGKYDPVRVYRYEGGTQWTDCGQPGPNLRINCMASYKGKLYAGGDRGMLLPGERQWKGRPYKVYVYEGGTTWKVSAEFPAEQPKNCYPHAMAVHDGKLYVGYPNVYSFDGEKWRFVGTPVGRTPKKLLPLLQVHCLEVFRGRLHAGMWPEARVVEYQGGEDWADRGRLGDGTEVNALTVYNGKLYGGAIPRAEVTRYDDERRWTSLHRFYSPKGWTPAPPDSATHEQAGEWTRVTSLTVYQGRLFASIGSCTASVLDAPADVRGQVYSMEAGKCVSSDDDIGPGWKHIAAIRNEGRLTIYIDGKPVAKSSAFNKEDYDISNDKPLKIGFGEMDYFSGKIKDVRVYNRALNDGEIRAVGRRTVANHFDEGREGWRIYDYNGGKAGGGNVFFPAVWEKIGGVENSGYIWADDSKWRVDTPEDPDSILPFIIYRIWVNEKALDVRGAKLSLYLRGDKLDLKGAKCLFWAFNRTRGTRYHYTGEPLKVSAGEWGKRQTIVLKNDKKLWYESWSRYSDKPASLDEVLRECESYGVSFVGFSAEVTGKLAMDEFVIETSP